MISDAATTATTTTTTTTDECRNEVMVNDVRRAYFYAKIDRDVFVELPPEDPEFGSGKVGKLRLCLYGTRNAAKVWQETISAHLVKIGFTRGVGHPSVFHHPDRQFKALVHGDDYVSAGTPQQMKRLEEELSKAYEIKTQSLGLAARLQREGKVLNRILRAIEAGWEVEADLAHAELVMEKLGLTGEKAVATPGLSGTDEDDLTDDTPLENLISPRCVALQLNYLGPDRPDALFAIKDVAERCRPRRLDRSGG